ncbi:helix-turn-helix domain-containing protein [Sphingomonas sp.]|uniref:helix-turn-helix domain-containing protein n=1 Tax=Sphingomonas sp. TaxID=28214 RepID=UPI0035A89E0B
MPNPGLPPEEYERVQAAVEAHGGNLRAAARSLGMPRQTLQSRLRVMASDRANVPERKADVVAYQALAKVWNDARRYPLMHDIERALGKSARQIKAQVDQFRARHAADFPAFAPLIHRRADGRVIPLSPGVMRQFSDYAIDPETIRKAPGFVVTAAQLGATLNIQVFNALKVYCAWRGFPLVILPITYGALHREDGELTAMFPACLKGHILTEDTLVAGGSLNLSRARMRPTLATFLTDQICELGGAVSQIFAAPKIELDHRPRIGHAYPKAVMTTGAITNPDYGADNLGQQDRSAELAVAAHDYAAIVVETKGRKFHFRQLVSSKRGEFYDIDPAHGGARLFTPKGHEHRPDAVNALVCGDWHTGITCPMVRKTTFGAGGMAETLRPDNVVLHDFVDCYSVSHWEDGQATRRAYKAPNQTDSMELELKAAVAELRWIGSRAPWAKLHVVASNHPEYISEYIEKQRFQRDNINLAFGAELFAASVADMRNRSPVLAQMRAIDPVVAYFRKHCPEVNAMERQDALLLPAGHPKSILCSMHGDKGPRGAPSRSTRDFAKFNHRVILGHNHTGVIWGPIWRAGTSTPLMQHYVSGPVTGWTNTHCVIFDNSQRQLLNIIGGYWHG